MEFVVVPTSGSPTYPTKHLVSLLCLPLDKTAEAGFSNMGSDYDDVFDGILCKIVFGICRNIVEDRSLIHCLKIPEKMT